MRTQGTTNQYERLGVPDALLGWNRDNWTRTRIQPILDHYKWRNRTVSPTKLNMMHELHMLAQEYDLTTADRIDILNALKSGKRPPKRKPRVRRVPHPKDWEADRKFTRNRARARVSSSSAATILNSATAQTPTGNSITDSIPNVTSSRNRDCVVCFETLNPGNTPVRRITSSCDHEPDICRLCLATSISTQLDSRVWDQIGCPSCDQRLGYQDVKAFADSSAFGRSESSIKLGPGD